MNIPEKREVMSGSENATLRRSEPRSKILAGGAAGKNHGCASEIRILSDGVSAVAGYLTTETVR